MNTRDLNRYILAKVLAKYQHTEPIAPKRDYSTFLKPIKP